jgi:hypothetical protein
LKAKAVWVGRLLTLSREPGRSVSDPTTCDPRAPHWHGAGITQLPNRSDSADRQAAPASLGNMTGMSRPAGVLSTGRRVWRPIGAPSGLMRTAEFGGGIGPRRRSGTRPASPGCQANPMGNADRTTNRRQAGGGTGKGKSNMAVAESRPVVPAVLYDVDEAAEALRLSRSVRPL